MRKFFAIFFLLIFWLSLSLGIIFINVRSTVFSPDYVKDVLSESNFYSQITDLIVDDYLDPEYIDQEVARQALTPQWLESLFTTIIDAVYDQFLFDADFSDLAEVYVDISSPKQAIIPMFTEFFASSYTSDLTVNFGEEQLSQALDNNIPNQVNLLSFIFFISQPPSIQFSSDPNEQFSFLKELGNKGDIESDFFSSFRENVETIKNLRVIVVFAMYVCLFLAFLSLLALVLLFLFRRPSMLNWLAISTLPPGLGAFFLAGIAKIYFLFNQSYIEKNADQVLAQAGEFASPKATMLYIDILYAFIHPLLNRMIIFGLILLILGILFLVLRKVIHKKA